MTEKGIKSKCFLGIKMFKKRTKIQIDKRGEAYISGETDLNRKKKMQKRRKLKHRKESNSAGEEKGIANHKWGASR